MNARGVALGVTVALSGNYSRMCVQTGVYERHLLENERDRNKGLVERAILGPSFLQSTP
jgi:ABC-type uncharacterized transport system substrate-binding protein